MNIKAVAKLAGVSTATVSRTINGSSKVHAETARRVQEAVQQLNYHPNVNARALGSGRSRLYGLIISDITNPFFPELVRCFEEVAVAHDQEVLIANTNYDQRLMRISVIRMLQRKVDGVAIMTSEMDDKLLDDFSHRNIPVVFFDVGSPGPGVSSVRVDYGAGIVLGLQHLLQLGHRRIGFISGPLRLASARNRQQAFLQHAASSGLDTSGALVQEGNHRVEGGRLAVERMLSAGKLPTAIICSNDLTAIGALGALHDRGIDVPGEVSLLGFDDIEFAASVSPPLTTLRIPRNELAHAAFHQLFNAREDDSLIPREGANVTLVPTLVVRRSTGPAPEGAAEAHDRYHRNHAS